ncbi:glycosyltransferase [Robertmurraya andreesenii]|uniref:Glycosyltransferase involved in cell wall biosynthesis n=1 Tax=Anoxybacillus andreesenii TaxID=1325932 RepID=A0ABT9V7I1_9BACL|nr:glycosyltransferase [Robertmurraya andreesenii]MDQ0156905.1 glycosyltransferase involved in cell wall biosynthesis [Robertmurraya andreesenii]
MNILLNIFTDDLQEKDFLDFSEPFETEGYTVFNFQYPLSGYYLDMVSTLLNYLSNEHGVTAYETRIVVQSNIGNLLIAWYRVYNDVIDDFIIVDRKITSFQSEDEGERILIEQLASLAAIEKDICHDRLYYRSSQPISLALLQPFMKCGKYNLLKPFEEINSQRVFPKRKIEKEYYFKNWSFKRNTEKVDERIDLTQKGLSLSSINLNEITTPYGFYFVFHHILNLPIGDLEKAKAAMLLNQHMNIQAKKKVTDYIINYLTVTEEKLSFKQVINFYSFLTMLGTDTNILKKLLDYIRKDENQLDKHYAVFTNVLFYITKANQKEYERYFLDRIEIMRKLKRYYKHWLNINHQRSENRLVIVTGQLLSYNHAPTKIAIDYANNIIKYFPNLKIKIVVEDMFNYSPNELFFVHQFSSISSRMLSNEHRKLLNPSIEVYYSDNNLSRIQRLQQDTGAITDFKPQWILKIGAPDSLVVDQLFDYYPVLSFSMGGAEYSEFVDLPFGGRTRNEVLIEREQKGLSNQNYNYNQFIIGLDFQEEKEKLERSELGFCDEDFVIVTVGNRLESEITNDFVDGINKILRENGNVKWLIVGTDSLLEVSNKMQDLLGNSIKFISYAPELMSMYKICDLYVNPFRVGGGISVAMAMFAGLPVASIKGETDANIYVSHEKSLSKKEYFKYIVDLIEDTGKYNYERDYFKQRIETKFSMKSSINQIQKFFLDAENLFLNRSKASLI